MVFPVDTAEWPGMAVLAVTSARDILQLECVQGLGCVQARISRRAVPPVARLSTSRSARGREASTIFATVDSTVDSATSASGITVSASGADGALDIHTSAEESIPTGGGILARLTIKTSKTRSTWRTR